MAYLVTIAFAGANVAYVRDVAEYYETELRAMASRHPAVIDQVEGSRHLSSVFFRSVEKTVRFTRQLSDAGIDISAHTHKADCPPAALTKLWLVSTPKVVDFIVARMEEAPRDLRRVSSRIPGSLGPAM